ncbi:MAG TPA: DNA starvation/stationary phase protection protein [Myxococcales bacterium]|jgi:starvation-inducible DNA-binding protein|nr:DNA starvation/stationary phase protection protein [Myxococcales bacterium]
MEKHASVIESLQRQQANSLVQFLNTKKYHWLTFGPHFRDLHLLLDEHAAAALEAVDEYAERALMIDAAPVTDPQRYLASATVRASEGQLSVRQMVEEALATHDKIIAELHQDAERAGEAGDIGTADLYTRLVQVQQKQRWFLKEILRKGSGLEG